MYMFGPYSQQTSRASFWVANPNLFKPSLRTADSAPLVDKRLSLLREVQRHVKPPPRDSSDKGELVGRRSA